MKASLLGTTKRSAVSRRSPATAISLPVQGQLGHGAELTLRTYRHVIEELEDSPQLPAEAAIQRARRQVGTLAQPATGA